MEDPSKLDNFLTTYDLLKIPKKKMTFKQLLYRRRIQIGNYSNFGIIMNCLQMKYCNNKITYQINHKDENDIDIIKDNEKWFIK